MDKNHLDELCRKEESYWWHVNRQQLVLDFLRGQNLLKNRILEIGCGGGMLSSLLMNAGANLTAADILDLAVRSARARGVDKGLVFDAARPWPFASNSFEVIIMLDVLEHIKNDMFCLSETRRVLTRDGLAVLTLPAHPFLFSGWDRVLGHYRRYSKSRLHRILKGAGFQSIVLSYHNVLSFLPALIIRGKDRLFQSQHQPAEFPPVPKIINIFLKKWGRLESALVTRGLPFGLSFFVVLKPI